MSQKIYRVGIIGCGMIAGSHAKMYSAHKRTEIVAIADINPENLRKFGEKWCVPKEASFTDHKSLLEKMELDIVSICTWHGSHAEIAIDCAEKGIPGIFCEKPMATSVGDAKKMLLSAKAHNTKLTVEHNRRYLYENIKARELIREGQIGKPQVVVVRTKSGMLNWATHVIDQVRYLLGDPETDWVIGQIERNTDRYERFEPIEDRAMGLICFKGGTRLVLECDLPGPDLSYGNNKPVIYGTEGHIIVGPTIRLLNKEGWQEYAPPEEQSNSGYKDHVNELISWIEGETDNHRCNGIQASYDVEIMMSIYESMRTKGIVYTPLNTRVNPLKEMLNNGDLPVTKPGRYDIRFPYWE